jgi:hypothetical protein
MFIVNCDALGTKFGAVLHPDNGPIAFYSRTIVPQHSKLVAYEGADWTGQDGAPLVSLPLDVLLCGADRPLCAKVPA